jgi:uncharacterized small protein (DUF1192 family)
MASFWAWGYGGSIKKYKMPNITKVDPSSVQRHNEIQTTIMMKQSEIDRLRAQLDDE